MEVFLVRSFLYTVFPLALGLAVVRRDRRCHSAVRRAEAMLVPLFVVGVAGSGIGAAFAHLLLSDQIAEAIGWDAGNPFQAEVGFANLALGALGAVAGSRRDGFREATVVAVTVFGVGASIVHVVDLLGAGNSEAGNTVQIVGNLVRPVMLVGLLAWSRRTEREPRDSFDSASFDHWRLRLVAASVGAVILASTAFAAGYAADLVAVWSAIGVVAATTVFVAILLRPVDGASDGIGTGS